MFTSSLSSASASKGTTSTSSFLLEPYGSSLVGKADLAKLAQAEGWHLAWPSEGHHSSTPDALPAGVEAIVVVHEQGHEAASAKVARSLARGGAGPPVFVLLFDTSGAAQPDFDIVMALQHDFAGAGAEDVLCNARTTQELRLAVALALRRRALKLDLLTRMRTQCAMEVDRSASDKVKDLEDLHATGLFWQFIDHLFKGFPVMDLRLPKEVEAGTTIGSCALDTVLGQGSFGKVYGGADAASGTREAIKAISKGSIKSCKQATALYREIDIHGRLEHHHIIRFFGVMHGPRHIFLRMEEASGLNLYKKMQSVSGSLPLADTKRFQAQLSDAVAYCHAQGVAHRDLKPENVALDAARLDIKLVDFGCSVRAASWRTDVVGSLPFMAPEVLIASVASPYEAAVVDVWACAVILVEMLLGAHHLSRRLGWERTTRAGPKRHGELVQYFSDGSAVPRLLRRRFGDVDTRDLETLLRGMFEVVPSERWSSRRVAGNRWCSC